MLNDVCGFAGAELDVDTFADVPEPGAEVLVSAIVSCSCPVTKGASRSLLRLPTGIVASIYSMHQPRCFVVATIENLWSTSGGSRLDHLFVGPPTSKFGGNNGGFGNCEVTGTVYLHASAPQMNVHCSCEDESFPEVPVDGGVRDLYNRASQ